MAITRDSIRILETPPPNKGGRPRVPEPRIPISARITPSEYDAITRAANERGVSLSEYVRLAVRRTLPRPGTPHT